MKNGLVAALVSAMLVAPGAILAQEETLEQLVIEMASTAAEHKAVADYFTARAEEARREVRRHEGMARAYTTSKTPQPQMRNHCQQLATKYEEIAAEYDELAKLHGEMASHASE